jgi:two-component system, NtrC family, sensor kinase
MPPASTKPEPTPRERAELAQAPRRALETNLTNLMLALETLDESIWIWDILTDELVVTSRWLRTLGYAEGELASTLTGILGLFHPDEQPAIWQDLQAHLEGRLPRFERELRLRRKDGKWIWLLTRARVVARDAQGRPLRMVGTNVEITASKHNEERMRALLSALPDLIFRQSRDGTYLDFIVNKPEELMVPPELLIGSNVRQLPMPPALLDTICTHLERAITEGTLEVFEYELSVAAGRLQHYESRITRSGPDEAVCIIRNITERKLAEERLHQQEEELRRHRDHLEELVQRRTVKLLQTTRELEERQVQLIQAEKLASIGQMAAGVAHEVSSPVGYVLSNLATLTQYVSTLTPLLELQKELAAGRGALSQDAREGLLARLEEHWKTGNVGVILEDMPTLIEESLEGARRIKEIVQSLRMFAREDSGEPQLADLNTELESTLRMVWNELKYKCTVERDFGPLPLLLCHPNQLAQVFTNLLVNAAQAIERQGVIRIRTRHEDNEVVVRISDTGKGMAPETLAKLFTPFFTTKPRGQGTGLGLSVSQSIIARHQGRLEVESAPGQGTTFRIHLPVTEL